MLDTSTGSPCTGSAEALPLVAHSVHSLPPRRWIDPVQPLKIAK